MAACPHLSFLESPRPTRYKRPPPSSPRSPHWFLDRLRSPPHQLALSDQPAPCSFPDCASSRRLQGLLLRLSRSILAMAKSRQGEYFEDHLPVMAERLGGQALVEELCVGFQLLAEPGRGLITFDSLKRNAAALGLGGMTDEELRGMLREGDSDGDGALNQMEFCVLMFRLSPELMAESRRVAGEALRYDVRANRRGFFS